MLEKKINDYIHKHAGKIAGVIGNQLTVELEVNGDCFSFKTCLGGEVVCEDSLDISEAIDYRLRELGLIE